MKTKTTNVGTAKHTVVLDIPYSKQITEVLKGMDSLLQYKNKKYGNAALEPLGIFSKLTGDEGIRVRLDDKIQRIKNSKEHSKNDISDLIGYLVLLSVNKDWKDFSEFKD